MHAIIASRFARRLDWSLRWSGWMAGLAAAASAGCGEERHLSNYRAPAPIIRAAGPEVLPPPEQLAAPREAVVPHPAAAEHAAKVLPISLDTVLRLAEDQNRQVGLARARVNEAMGEEDVARKAWLPDVYVGTAWYRHEGGIQNPRGNLVHASSGAFFNGVELNSTLDVREIAYRQVSAERRSLQQKGDLSRITFETLLDAASTYIDLLAARTGEAIARDQLVDLEKLLERASPEPGARVEIERINAEIEGRRQTILKLQSQGDAASAKLVYLLGLDPCTQLVPVDARLVPLELVDASPPTCDLVARAMRSGPGLAELEAMLALIDDSIERSKGFMRYMPIVEVRAAEGLFGAGAGSYSTFDNRFDFGVQVRWNLSEGCTRHERQRVAMAQIEQVHIAHQDLQAKLTAGVQESRGSILSGSQQLRLGQKQIDHARETYQLSDKRLANNIPGSSTTEVLLSLQSMALAQMNYVQAVRDYDRAQLRLMLLTGAPLPADLPHAPADPGPALHPCDAARLASPPRRKEEGLPPLPEVRIIQK